jgi:DinB family protein
LSDLQVSVPVSPGRVAELIPALEETTAEISSLLEAVADDQDWRPNDEHWSFRHIAAHLEACQTECVLVRVRQIAAGSKPTFEFYDNDGWDFSDRDLRHSLREWRESRARVFEFVRSLSSERLSRTGSHRTFGEITALDYLKVDLDHDRAHLADLNEMLRGRVRSREAANRRI